MNNERYEGPSGGLKKDSPWLASEDIGDNERRVVIEDVTLHKNVAFDKGRVEAKIGALKLSGIEKRMVLNATNRKKLVKLFGMDTREWRGKTVTLWVDTNVKMAGEIVNGLRIKEAAAQASAPTPPAPDRQSLLDIGEAKIREGGAVFDAWTATLTPAEKRAIGKEQYESWKQAVA